MKNHLDTLSNRRNFLRNIALGSVGTLLAPSLAHAEQMPISDDKPATNIADALKHPRTALSMPGKFPGRVTEVYHDACIVNNKPDARIANAMLERSMLELTGAKTISSAWGQFVSPADIIGLKVNPVAGKELSTSLEIVHAIIGQLVEAGIPKKNIVIWDRREFELYDAGFTAENFPGIRITGTECKDDKGSFYDAKGKLYGEARIDKDWFYWADCEDKYDAETLPYMINEGKNSYFGSVITKELTKIINIPILKNAGPTVTLCLKNLAYGAITNTGRLHAKLWGETCAQVPCFPPLRDKVVLNIVDGFIGCYNGGPGANPQFIMEFKTLMVGSDPVAVDRMGYEIILKKRIEKGVQKEDSPRGTSWINLAASYQLGVADKAKIDHSRVVMS
jgi:hypothetical protein